MATVNNKLTNLANEIRELSGVTEPLGLDEMATNVNDANDEVADQTDLIAQLASVLRGKSIEDEIAYTVYVGSTAPTAEIGKDGDIYIVRSVTA